MKFYFVSYEISYIFAASLIRKLITKIIKNMKSKERMYRKAVLQVARLVREEGYSLTAARLKVSLKTGISYPLIVRLTKDPSQRQRKEEGC